MCAVRSWCWSSHLPLAHLLDQGCWCWPSGNPRVSDKQWRATETDTQELFLLVNTLHNGRGKKSEPKQHTAEAAGSLRCRKCQQWYWAVKESTHYTTVGNWSRPSYTDLHMQELPFVYSYWQTWQKRQVVAFDMYKCEELLKLTPEYPANNIQVTKATFAAPILLCLTQGCVTTQDKVGWVVVLEHKFHLYMHVTCMSHAHHMYVTCMAHALHLCFRCDIIGVCQQ